MRIALLPACSPGQRLKDWLDTLGMKVPETIDEYYQAAVAMTKQDQYITD